MLCDDARWSVSLGYGQVVTFLHTGAPQPCRGKGDARSEPLGGGRELQNGALLRWHGTIAGNRWSWHHDVFTVGTGMAMSKRSDLG